MNGVLGEWIEKAEEDFHVASASLRSRKHPLHNAVCFHAQQCVEKYLKAVRVKHGVEFGKTHDLQVLLNGCLAVHPMWEAWRASLKELSEYAVSFRYPGESAGKNEARRAALSMRQFRKELRAALGLHAATTRARRTPG
jgi:HEPN domain-containing protein